MQKKRPLRRLRGQIGKEGPCRREDPSHPEGKPTEVLPVEDHDAEDGVQGRQRKSDRSP